MDELSSSYSSVNNAQVNFYHWNKYRLQEKYKSHGREGETQFYIGKQFVLPSNDNSQADFNGKFPEYISFPHELNPNERNRVESYLALKYGLTLEEVSYRNAINIVFWKKENYNIFHKRIFGIGRDKISNLNQLISESTHNLDFLTVSVGEFADTNKEKQAQVNIPDNNFIVFGDNGGGLSPGTQNDVGVRLLQRKWLSQNTGKETSSFPLFFKLNIAPWLSVLSDPEIKLWMLHDKNVTNQELSDFNNNYVDYYEPDDITSSGYAIFEKKYFDPDSSYYDQFTFGIGPEIIVQVRFPPDQCNRPKLNAEVVITGGKAPYNIMIHGPYNYHEEFNISNNTLNLQDLSAGDYTVVVTDVNHVEAETEFEVVPTQIEVDLGPDLTLTASQSQIILDAGQGVNDPEATFEWFKDNASLEHYESEYTVEEPGEYKVIITSGNRACEVSDSILIEYEFSGIFETEVICEENQGLLFGELLGGVPNYNVKVFDINNNEINNLPTNGQIELYLNYGSYTLKFEDAIGNTFEEQVVIEDPLEGIDLDIYSQLSAQCQLTYEPSSSSYPWLAGGCVAIPIILDASLLVSNPNVEYEWSYTNTSGFCNVTNEVFSSNPTIEINDAIGLDECGGGHHEITIKITNTLTDCYISQTFASKSYWSPEVEPTSLTQENEISTAKKNGEEKNSYLTTRVYPNPSDPDNTFYHEVSINEKTDVKVEVYTVAGSLLFQTNLTGESFYQLPLNLSTSGVYFIVTTSNQTVKTDRLIIR
ncbi:T9SS type A sorting domain-containing protein [Mesonia aquimarina]|uniref:T9SS type A sorting domain-containing protein n=1 Tax=Mesonia aquimarina TaxID=1504967 RepID=UPI000EF6039B|nr:T9SS type A sorting domain-containing protein [Mesonia aquimarina]